MTAPSTKGLLTTLRPVIQPTKHLAVFDGCLSTLTPRDDVICLHFANRIILFTCRANALLALIVNHLNDLLCGLVWLFGFLGFIGKIFNILQGLALGTASQTKRNRQIERPRLHASHPIHSRVLSLECPGHHARSRGMSFVKAQPNRLPSKPSNRVVRCSRHIDPYAIGVGSCL
jgi:hypothetical protein